MMLAPPLCRRTFQLMAILIRVDWLGNPRIEISFFVVRFHIRIRMVSAEGNNFFMFWIFFAILTLFFK